MGQLIDAFNRRITYMRISITGRCNLKCTYCVPSCGSVSNIPIPHMLTYEEILHIVRVGARHGLNKIRITGGEPLVRKGVVDFVAALSRIEGIRDIAMTTNAVLLRNYAEPLKKAGLRRVNISLDTFDPVRFKEITRGDCFDRVWEGILEAERVGFNPVKINCVVTRGVNDHEVVEFAKLTLNRKIQVRFIEFMPVDDWESWKRQFVPKAEMIQKIEEALGTLHPVHEEEKTGPAVLYKLEGAAGEVGFISAISEHFCDTCNRVRLTADGKMKHCLFSESYVDFREPLRRGCSDEEIEALFWKVMETRPEGHKIEWGIDSQKFIHNMTSIGG